MSMDFARRYRPRDLDEVVGQEEAVATVRQKLDDGKLRHVIMLFGPTGAGKTTIARIIGTHLMGRPVADVNDPDFREINCGSCDPMETVKDVQRRMGMSPLTGKVKCYYFDELQAFSRSGFSQQGMLKMLEDTPDHVYFLLATTNPDKIIRTIRGRSTKIELKAVGAKPLRKLITRVLEGEKIDDFPTSVITRIVEAAEGSARGALVMLDLVVGLESEQAMLEAIQPEGIKKKAFDIVSALVYRHENWGDVAKILIELEGKEEPERLRHFILACAKTEILKNGKKKDRAYLVLDCFCSNVFDSGFPGLVRAAYEASRQ